MQVWIERALVCICVAATPCVGAAPITTLFNTGVDINGQPVANGMADPNYTLISAPTGSSLDTRVIDPSGGLPFPFYEVGSNVSRWILADNPVPNVGSVSPTGDFTFRTTFNLTGFLAGTASINGNWWVDNYGVQILLNGVAVPIAFSNLPVNNFYSGAPAFGFSIASGFVSGINTLDFVVQNFSGTDGQQNPVALRVEMTGDADRPVPEPGTPVLLGAAVLAACVARRRVAPTR